MNDEPAERDVTGVTEPAAYQVHWFHPERPVEGTVFVRPSDDSDVPAADDGEMLD
jgi:hypothetical protein